MRSIKLFLIIVSIIIAFLFLITAFLPSKVTVSKSVLVEANQQKITRQINDFKNWKNWYPAFQNKNIIINIEDRNDISSAKITSEKNKIITFFLQKSPDNTVLVVLYEESKNDITYQFSLIPSGNDKTQLTWNINTSLGWYPWRKIAGIFLDKVTGTQYETVLMNLKAASEK